MCPPPPSGLACLSCNGLARWRLALTLSLSLPLGLGLGLGQAGRAARGKGCAQWQGSPANVPSKISLSPGGRQRKIDSGEHPKIEALHCYLAWVHAYTLSGSLLLLLPLNLASGPTGGLHAHRCRAPFPSKCLLALLAGWTKLPKCALFHHMFCSWPTILVENLPISLPRHLQTDYLMACPV